MGQIHVDEMSVDILCTDLRDFRAKCVGAVSKNVFKEIVLKEALNGTDPCGLHGPRVPPGSWPRLPRSIGGKGTGFLVGCSCGVAPLSGAVCTTVWAQLRRTRGYRAHLSRSLLGRVTVFYVHCFLGGSLRVPGAPGVPGGVEVVVRQARSECVKSGLDRGSGCGDMSRGRV